MKKLFKTLALAICVLFAGVALAACGGKKDGNKVDPLTADDVVGLYHVSNVCFTPEEGNALECSYQEICDLRGQGELEGEDLLKWQMFDDGATFFVEYEVTKYDEPVAGELGEILNSLGQRIATWKIENNELVVTPIAGKELDGATTEMVDEKVFVTLPWADPAGEVELTIEKWTMADFMMTIAGEETEMAVYKIMYISYTPDEDAEQEVKDFYNAEGVIEMDAADWEALVENHEKEEAQRDADMEEEFQKYVDYFDGGIFFTFDIMPDGRGLIREDENHNQYGRFWFENGYLKYQRIHPNYAACTYDVEWDYNNEVVYITVNEPSSVSGQSGAWQYTLERIYPGEEL